MPSGGGLHLFFNVNQIPCGPPAPPPPEVGPGSSGPSTIIGAVEGNLDAYTASLTLDLSGFTVLAGDILVAFFYRLASTGFSMVGNLPPGFVLFREDNNPAVGAIHPNLYTGIASKVAAGGETTLTFSPGAGALFYADVVIVRNSSGIDKAALTEITDNLGTSASVAGVVTAFDSETIFICCATSAAGAPELTSADGYPEAAGDTGSRQAMYSYTAGAAGLTASKTVNDTQALEGFSGYQLAMKPA
jgi:hypothetical protein